jgi:hypothetical protein
MQPVDWWIGGLVDWWIGGVHHAPVWNNEDYLLHCCLSCVKVHTRWISGVGAFFCDICVVGGGHRKDPDGIFCI